MTDALTSSNATIAAFTGLGLDQELAEAMDQLKLSEPTPIQCSLVPAILSGRDCLVRTRPGTGKTNAYLLPMLQRVRAEGGLQALILQPTRALALQIERNIRRFSGVRPVRTAVAAGPDRPHGPQARLDPAPDVLVSSPRRALELIEREALDLSNVSLVIIDEAEALISNDSFETLADLLDRFEHEHQIVLVSGHWTDQVRALSDDFMHEPAEIDNEANSAAGDAIEQRYARVESGARFDALRAFCRAERAKLVIVFTCDLDASRALNSQLDAARMAARSIDDGRIRTRADRERRRRDRMRAELILAHDPASPRLSTVPATHIVHMDLPDSCEAYFERLDQCARVNRKGFSLAFVGEAESDRIAAIEARGPRPLQLVDPPATDGLEPIAGDAEDAPDARGRFSREHDSRSQDSRSHDRRGRERGRGDRDDRGRRGGRERRGGGEHPASRDAATARSMPPGGSEGLAPPTQPTRAAPAPSRKVEPIRRDPVLEARGVQPVPRTLGSRFRPARRTNRLRAPT